MMNHLLTCKCGEVVVKSANGTTKIRNKMLVIKGNRSFAVCKGCGAEILVPIKLEPCDFNNDIKQPRLFIENRK